jgi:hypothetical protein
MLLILLGRMLLIFTLLMVIRVCSRYRHLLLVISLRGGALPRHMPGAQTYNRRGLGRYCTAVKQV